MGVKSKSKTMIRILLSGVEFNDLFKEIKIYKIIRKSMIHFGFHYKQGLNIDTTIFNPNTIYKNGMHSTFGNYVDLWFQYYELYSPDIWNVEIPDDAVVAIYKNNIKTDKIILTSKLENLKNIFLLTQDIADKLSEKNQNALIFFPDHLKTESMCHKAMVNNVQLIGYLPDKAWAQPMREKAVNDCPDLLKCLRLKFITSDMCEKAVSHNYKLFVHVPEYLKTREMCKEVVKNDIKFINYVSNEFRTSEMLEICK